VESDTTDHTDGIGVGRWAFARCGAFAIKLGSRFFAVPRTDEVAIIFCGSQKSAITGVPMAHLLFTGPAAGMIVLPIIIYHQLQLWLGAWLARRYASAAIVDHLAEGSVDLGIRAIRVRPPSGPSGL
jgi:predicted Na+-dependent transporter